MVLQNTIYSSGVYICKSIVNHLRHGNYTFKSERIYRSLFFRRESLDDVVEDEELVLSMFTINNREYSYYLIVTHLVDCHDLLSTIENILII
jgi:hypothetical protein